MNEFKVLISGFYNAFNEGWNGAGVYMVSGNYVSETFKQPIYIGSAKNLQNRIEHDHIQSLKRGNHQHSNLLQNSWNKHGSENFVWFLLETCENERQTILDTEQKYLDFYRPFADEFGGFNISHFAFAPSHLGWKHTELAKQKISQSNTGKKHTEETKLKLSKSHSGKTLSKEHKEKLSKIRKGEKNPFFGKKQDPETVKRIAEKHCKHYKFLNPDGELVKIFNITKFCRENNLSAGSMIKVFKGEYRQHKKWTRVPIKEIV